VDPQKPAGENGALQECVKLPFDKARHFMFGRALLGENLLEEANS
jgi:hypothetical protein